MIVNGENAAGGFGITEAIYQEIIEAGADAVTLGNHAWDQREALVFIERAPALIRPVNYPPGTPGRGAALITAKNGARVLVINALGPHLHRPARRSVHRHRSRDCRHAPSARAADAIVVDFHAEATSEKQSMGHFLDGRASLVVGTHTHAQTADHHVLPGGTAFISDAGMTGDYDSVLGMGKQEPLARFLRRIPSGRFEPAMGPATLCGVAVETDDKTGLAQRIAPSASVAYWRRRAPCSGSELLPLPLGRGCPSEARAVRGVGKARMDPLPVSTASRVSTRSHKGRGSRAHSLFLAGLPITRRKIEDGLPMAGHSQFKNIMHRKGRQDEVRAKLFSKLGARNHRVGKARHARPGDQSAAARRHHRRARRKHAEGQYRARHQEGGRAATPRTTTRFATRVTAQAESPSSSKC